MGVENGKIYSAEVNDDTVITGVNGGKISFSLLSAGDIVTLTQNADKTAASEIWQSLKEGVRADIQAANTHYAQYEGKVQDAATKVNDTYLRAFSEEAGVQSYGEAADRLIAWYLKKK